MSHFQKLLPADGLLLRLITVSVLTLSFASCADNDNVADTTTTQNSTTSPTPTPIPLATQAPPPGYTPTPDPNVPVQVEFPTWVEESPKMAYLIAWSEIVVKASLVSIHTELVEREKDLDYWVDLIYTFNVEEYLKGAGGDELTVVEHSGPKANFDILKWRSKEEALQLAASWLQERKQMAAGNKNAIILALQPDHETHHLFTEQYSSSYLPIIETSWLPLVEESENAEYQHQLTDDSASTIELSQLRNRVLELSSISGDEYSDCVTQALYNRDKVRDYRLGTLQVSSGHGSWVDPYPFPKYEFTINPQNRFNYRVFWLNRPPFQTPRFSHYWLDGRDSELFEVHIREDGDSYEMIWPVEDLQPGEYKLYYSQFHRSLPCNQDYRSESFWISSDTMNITVKVEGKPPHDN